jgi:hypothetical protein
MISLVIDVQSDSVQGSVVDFAKDPMETLYSTSAIIPRKEHVDGEYLTKMTVRAIEDLCAHVVKNLPTITKEPLKSIHYVLSAPWVISQSKTVEIHYEKDTEITESAIKTILDADHKELVKKYESDMIFLEQKIFDVELNGYSVENYTGKKARTLKVSFAFTLSSDKIIQKIHTAVAKVLHAHREEYHSAVLLQYLASRSVAPDGGEYIVLHVHGELTELVIVKKGFSAYLGTFPYGIATLIRKCAHSKKCSIAEADSMMKLYQDGKLEDSELGKAEEAFAPLLKGWQSECSRVFQEMGKGIVIPKTVYLYMESPLLPLFKKTLEKSGLTVVTHAGSLRERHVNALRYVVHR